MAICYREGGNGLMEAYEKEVREREGRLLALELDNAFGTLRKTSGDSRTKPSTSGNSRKLPSTTTTASTSKATTSKTTTKIINATDTNTAVLKRGAAKKTRNIAPKKKTERETLKRAVKTRTDDETTSPVKRVRFQTTGDASTSAVATRQSPRTKRTVRQSPRAKTVTRQSPSAKNTGPSTPTKGTRQSPRLKAQQSTRQYPTTKGTRQSPTTKGTRQSPRLKARQSTRQFPTAVTDFRKAREQVTNRNFVLAHQVLLWTQWRPLMTPSGTDPDANNDYSVFIRDFVKFAKSSNQDCLYELAVQTKPSVNRCVTYLTSISSKDTSKLVRKQITTAKQMKNVIKRLFGPVMPLCDDVLRQNSRAVIFFRRASVGTGLRSAVVKAISMLNKRYSYAWNDLVTMYRGRREGRVIRRNGVVISGP